MMEHQLVLTPKQQQKLSAKAIQGLQLLALPITDLSVYLDNLMIENPLIEHDYSMDGVNEKREEIIETDFSSRIDRRNKNGLMDAFANGEAFCGNIPETETLHGFLRLQLHLSRLTKMEIAVGEKIIGNINEKGYFVGDVYEIAYQYEQDLSVIEKVLRTIQSFSPLGVGATSIEECLILQVDRNIPNYEKIIAIIHDDLEALADRKITRLTRNYGLGREELQEIFDYIRTLSPRPGNKFEQNATAINYVIPDVVVKRENFQYMIYINNEMQPQVYMNRHYLQMLQDRTIDNEEKEYLRGKRNEARMILKGLEMRNETLKKLAMFIVRGQQAFFDNGPQGLKPLMMQNAADEIGVHVSTISRAVQGKYIETPWGMYPLRYFFCSSIKLDATDGISSIKIKNKIQKMIKEEDRLNPLSDSQIVQELKEEGINVSRRTVAKYRLGMGIEGQNKRKHFS